MEKKLLNIESLEPNHVLTADIYHYNTGVVLYKKGTVLTNERISKLKNFGNISIYVETDKIYEKTTDIVRRKLEVDLEKIYKYANSIVLNVIEKKNLKELLKLVEDNVYDHSYNVAILAAILGMNIQGIDGNQLEQLVISALLHDIGKSTIDFSILNKPGSLTDEEYEIIKTHSKVGYDILKSTELFDDNICDAVLCHHENEDGTGYPNNIDSNKIPLFAKIIHICDVYSALIAKRCYKEAWTYQQTIEELNSNRDKYNRELLEMLKIILPFYLKGDVVLLSTGELATVVYVFNGEILVQTFGTNKYYKINKNESIYVKRKIKTR